MKKLFILDGSGFLYRAYYAFPEIINHENINVNVVYGFFRMLLKILQLNPDYFLITRDSPTKTHRHIEYPEYKANRAKAPDDFKQQIPIVQDIVNQIKIPSLVAPGYEADDIIATIAINHRQEDELDTFIYSSDKDLKQLLDNNTHIIEPIKNRQIKTKDFLQEFMFEPKYILDYLSLVGDSSDNIKGVEGVGPKTASTLIIKYHNLDNIYLNIDEISPSVKDRLLKNKEMAYYSKSLIMLQEIPELKDVDLETYSLDIDFNLFQKVLVQDHKFTAMEKIIKDLKHKLTAPQQNSLF